MALSPDAAYRLAQGVVGHYQEAEKVLMRRIARNLAAGIDAPEWAERKLGQLRAYRRQAEALLDDLAKAARTSVATALSEAYRLGGLAAVADLSRLGASAAAPLPGLRAIEALQAQTLGHLLDSHPAILRSTTDVYRSIIAETSQQVLMGSMTQREACQAALDRFAKAGIPAFWDKKGRKWSLETYTNMAMRTACGNAAIQGHIDRLQANGLDLVIVTDAHEECPLCRPWEGKVLSIGGLESRREETPDATPPTLEEQPA